MYTFLRPLFLWFVKKQTQNILGEKVQTCLMYLRREEHQDNLNTAVFLAVMILDSKSVCRTSGSKPVGRTSASNEVSLGHCNDPDYSKTV